jgi:hypothetical protein
MLIDCTVFEVIGESIGLAFCSLTPGAATCDHTHNSPNSPNAHQMKRMRL